MKKFLIVLLSVSMFSCSSDSNSEPEPPVNTDVFIRGADMSYLPLIESEGTIYKHNSVNQDPITTLKNAGCNAIRIRLWQNPSDGHSGMAEVKTFAQRVKAAGLKVWLTVHYSDTWVRPVERSLSWLAWAAVVLWLTGLLPMVLEELDQIQWKVGTSHLSVRTLIEERFVS